MPDRPNTESYQLSNAGLLMVITKDLRDQVAKWYTNELTKLGWILGSQQGGTSSDPIMMIFTKETSVIQIVVSTDGQTTTVMINEMKQ